MSDIAPLHVIDAHAVDLPREAVPDDQLLAGAPTTAFTDLLTVRDATVGLWEMTEGGMRDVEVDEVFVVLSGRATVQIAGPDSRAIELAPGSLCRFAAGTATEWTVHERLRKLYVIGMPEAEASAGDEGSAR